jgi:hypothetical protein
MMPEGLQSNALPEARVCQRPVLAFSCYILQTRATTCTGFVAVCLIPPLADMLYAKKCLIVYLNYLRRVPHDSAEPDQYFKAKPG